MLQDMRQRVDELFKAEGETRILQTPGYLGPAISQEIVPLRNAKAAKPELGRLLALDDPLNDELATKSQCASGFLR